MKWWQGTSIYQVYPRSFADGNNDGIGDLPGIIGKLDYIAELGVKTVWVSPFFASPQRDFGYDITDYRNVAPEYGTLADAEELIVECHNRGLKVMFDLVLNHTSDEHPWFKESSKSRIGPKADWYIWRDGRGKDGKRPPNNWRSILEVKSAWQWSEERRQWYLATFLPFQPDLNWRNPDVKAEMFNTVRFWLDRGVDGFRLDIFGAIMKDPEFRNNPMRPELAGAQTKFWRRDFTENTEDTIALAKDLRAVCNEYSGSERILLGEVFGPPEVLHKYLGNDDGLQLVFLFDFLTYSYSAEWFTKTIETFESNFPDPKQPTYVLENHDRSRTIDRVDGDVAKARVLAVILLTMRGVSTVYYGQEIAMANTHIPIKDALDPIAKTFFKWVPNSVSSRLDERINRDEMRTPMQWNGSPNAGFCTVDVKPWLPVNGNYLERNARAQADDPYSTISLYRQLFKLRSEYSALSTGKLQLLRGLPEGVLGYVRSADDSPSFTILANMSDGPKLVSRKGQTAKVTAGSVTMGTDDIVLAPNSAVVLTA